MHNSRCVISNYIAAYANDAPLSRVVRPYMMGWQNGLKRKLF